MIDKLYTLHNNSFTAKLWSGSRDCYNSKSATSNSKAMWARTVVGMHSSESEG